MPSTNSTPSDRDSVLESVYEEFEAAWQECPFPSIAEFLTHVPDALTAELIRELVHIDLERRWCADIAVSETDPLPSKPLLEDYANAFDQLGPVETLPLDLIEAECIVRHRWGDRPASSEYVERFPTHAVEVRAICEQAVAGLSGVKATKESNQRSNFDEETVITGKAGAPPQQKGEDVANANSVEQSFQTLGAGSRIDHYVLGTKLGEGGCGVVFRAQNVNRPYQECAIKFIRPDRASDPKVLARFQQEIAALTGLSHPNIACATGSGEWEGIQFLVMEYVDGTSVSRLLSRTRHLPVAEVCELIRQAASGLQHIHENQRTHRDLKPSNLMLTTEGTVKILDLGMARLMDIDDPDERLTSIGAVMGTPDYMAPEQWEDSGHVDIRADIYSLGCTLFALLSGRPPFSEASREGTLALMEAHRRSPPPDPSANRDDLPPDLISLLRQCLSKSPNDRPQCPSDLAVKLEGFTDGAELRQLKARREQQDHSTPAMASTRSRSPSPETSDTTPTASTPDTEIDGKTAATVDEAGALSAYQAETLIEVPPETEVLEFEATLIERRHKLEGTLAEATLKPRLASDTPRAGNRSRSQPDSRTGSSGSRRTLGSYSSVGSVVLKQRDVTFGRISDDSSAEYEIGRKLGEGGMGAVFQARQGSIDRSVALKMVKGKNVPLDAQEKFLAEAVVTGALEHPNIVPIYDLGANAEGELFYAMKEVRGVPWRATIDTASADDNLDVLVKVTDAIAFAHSKGVLHRDLKPDNVMIGEFGEVLVMDWGLALPTESFEKPGISVTHGPAGTPSYMAPEMTGQHSERLGICSDVYLLGALLFRCVTGKPPHSGRHAFAALQAAADNVIDWPADADVNADLLSIARRAMETQPKDRFESAQAFQAALRNYRSHAESRRLTESAIGDLNQAEATSDYRGFERAIAALEEALHLWPENERARLTRQRAGLSYAQSAFNRGDLELAESQLDGNDETHTALLSQIRQARAVRDAQTRRMRRLRQTAAGLAAAVFLTVSVAAVLINRARELEAVAKGEAVDRYLDSQAAIHELVELADALQEYPQAQNERESLLQTVVDYYKRQTGDLSSMPKLRFEQIKSLLMLGKIQNQLARYEQALKTWQQMDALVLALPVNVVTGKQLELTAARKSLGKARTLTGQGRFSDAIGAARRATATLSDLLRNSADNEIRYELALAQLQLAETTYQSPQPKLAEQSASQAITHFSQLNTNAAAVGYAATESLLARLRERDGRYTQAAESIASAIRIWNRLQVEVPGRIDYADGLATSQIDRANVLRAAGRDPLSDYSVAVDSFQQLIELRPGIPRYRFNLGAALTGLAWTQNRLCLTAAAQDSAVQAVNGFLYLHEGYPQDARFPLGEVSARIVLAEILRDRSQLDLAVDIIGEAHRVLTEELPAELPDVRERGAEALLLFGQLQSSLGESQVAAQSLQQAAAELQALASEPAGVQRQSDAAAWALFYLAHEQANSGNAEGATTSFDQAIQIRRQLPDRATWLDSHAWLLLQAPLDALRDDEAARQIVDRAVALADRNPRFLRTRALAELRLGLTDAASRTLKESRALLQSPHPEQLFMEAMLSARQDQAQAQKQFDEAARLMDEVAPANPRLLLIRNETAELSGLNDANRETVPNMPTGQTD